MTQRNNQFKLCLTTVADKPAAYQLSQELLQQKLVACVNISSQMTSLYHWKNEIIEEHEYLLMMKTTSDKLDELQQLVLQKHPYEVPEFIIINIEDGSLDYFNWVNSVLS